MPKSKTKTAPTPTNDDSDEEVGASQAQPSQAALTQAKKALSSLSRDEVDSKVNDLVQYLLIQDQKKLPIKRQDINKHVLKEHSKAFVVMMEKAKAKLLEVFGIELVELESKQKSYILVNTIENEPEKQHQEWPPEDNAKIGFIMVLLSVIFMKGNVMLDTELYHFLRKLGVDTDATHEVFGDVKKYLMGDLVRQGYLECTRVPTTDPPVYEYRWGQRAKHETSKRHVLDFVCQIYELEDPKIWTSQWQDVLRSDNASPAHLNGGESPDNGNDVQMV